MNEMMVSTVWSVYCLLFFYSRCPSAQSSVKVGARAPMPDGVGAIGPLPSGFRQNSQSAPVHIIRVMRHHRRSKYSAALLNETCFFINTVQCLSLSTT